jgi:hypothetical protein
MYKIDKDVPVPKHRDGAWINLASKMEVNDSVFVKTEKEKNSLSSAINRSGGSCISSKEEKGFRVWKIEKKTKQEQEQLL